MPPERRTSFRTIALLMFLPIAGLTVFLAALYVREHYSAYLPKPRAVEEAGVVAPPKKTPRPHAAPAPVAPVEEPEPPKTAAAPHRRDIVLILDDVGFDRQPLAGAMQIDPNINFAVLPNGAKSQQFARELHDAGFELLCHLPMEPESARVSPGANAVLTSMSDAQIEATTRANVLAIPHIRGVNNHMGSRATSDRRVMTSVLSALPKGLYFIDSRTSGTSVAAPLARSMKIPTASRSVFLDDVPKDDAIRKQLESLAATADARGVAIGIGHMYPETVRVLAADAPSLRERGFRFIRASEAVN